MQVAPRSNGLLEMNSTATLARLAAFRVLIALVGAGVGPASAQQAGTYIGTWYGKPLSVVVVTDPNTGKLQVQGISGTVPMQSCEYRGQNPLGSQIYDIVGIYAGPSTDITTNNVTVTTQGPSLWGQAPMKFSGNKVFGHLSGSVPLLFVYDGKYVTSFCIYTDQFSAKLSG